MERTDDFARKQEQLLEMIKEWAGEDICLAFSGGVDSSLLLALAAGEASRRGTKVYAVTFQTELHPQADLEIAARVAAGAGAEHVVIRVDEFEDPRITENPVNRCYLCKKLLFSRLLEFAREKGIHTVLEGTNHDDLSVYRPGLRAVRELGVKSPLAMCGMTKQEVRELAKRCGLSVAGRPSSPCLATRLPYGAKIERELLGRIDRGEEYLKSLGFSNVRIRQHGNITRIEVDRESFPAVAAHAEKICRELQNMGMRYITLDLQGFRSGSMDEYLSV